MEKLSFYDVKSKKKFESDVYKVQEKSGRFFAVGIAEAFERASATGHAGSCRKLAAMARTI
ncbi:MAG: hypothetical protein FGM26_13180 [Beijerinckiaceae bacterium]|nr:hypothetical protein [Beijerinckiaceae bacterium]